MQIVNIDYEANLNDCITWQYQNAPRLSKLINYKNDFHNELNTFLKNWHEEVFNLKTAGYFGLIVWSLILSHTNYVQLRSRIGSSSFGFGKFHVNFFESNFGLSDYIYSLKTEELRQILIAQCYNLESNGSLYDLNRIVNQAFPGHEAFVTADEKTRTITYHFKKPLNENELSIAAYSNILQVPVGTKRKIINGEEEIK